MQMRNACCQQSGAAQRANLLSADYFVSVLHKPFSKMKIPAPHEPAIFVFAMVNYNAITVTVLFIAEPAPS